MIELADVTKVFSNLVAVDSLSLKIPGGEVFGFLGPNGAGKTTTMKMIAGLLEPTRGRILVNGIDITREPVGAKAMMGFIPDSPYLYEKLTAREFMEFVAEMYGVDRTSGTSRIMRLLDLFGLQTREEELIQGYSHGMKQRLVMAAALLHEPKVLIIDEPMVGLDPKGAILVKRLFTELAHEKGVTIFLSTHTLNVAEEICDETAIIHHGKLVAQGTLQNLRKRAQLEGGDLEEVFLKLTESE
ncbi:MAG: ABC transporter ATP-binding protein [Deltaproteobacteria bacterium]|nr:ABC transporter ATP-binding protein [Deltaproteobacteria bacterium]